MTQSVGRYAEPHPADPEFVAYSTVEKTPGAPDADREADEDIWLAWIRNLDDPSANFYYQITGDELEVSDNSYPRWNPSGTELAFVHVDPSGTLEVWKVAITLPVIEDLPPTVGVPQMVAVGRDPAWLSDTEILFVESNKIYSIDVVPGGPSRGGPVQLSFDPPVFASNEEYVDRHPSVSPDGAIIFNTIGRQNVADLQVEAFAIDESVVPADTTQIDAYISFQSPNAPIPSYPASDPPDTLVTPVLLRSIPVGQGGDFTVRVRRDSRFLPDSTMGQPTEVYCDTFLTQIVTLAPDTADSVQFYFREVRGSLRIRTGLSSTTVRVERADGRTTINSTISSPAGSLLLSCLIPFEMSPGFPDDVIDTNVYEPYVITATRGSKTEVTVIDALAVGESTDVLVFATSAVAGRVVFSDNPTIPFPQATIAATEAESTQVFVSATSDSIGLFSIALTQGTWSLRLSAQDYDPVVLTDFVVSPPTPLDLGDIVLNRTGTVPRSEVRPAAARALPASPTRAFGAPESPPTRLSAATRGDGVAANSAFRAPGDLSTVWRLDLTDESRPAFLELFGSPGLIQNPALTSDLGGGRRYVAYVSNVDGDWELFVQRLSNWQRDGDPVRIETPGTSDNLDCTRKVFHPRWIHGSNPPRLLVTMTDCPDNGFEDLGFDDDPWAVGELRLWQVVTSLP